MSVCDTNQKIAGTYAHLILDAGDVEHGLDLLPQLEPHPVAELHVLAQVALHHAEGNPAERRRQDQLDSCFMRIFGVRRAAAI